MLILIRLLENRLSRFQRKRCLRIEKAGLGTAIAPLFLVIDSLMSGRLVAPSGFIADGTQYIALLRKPLAQHSAEEQFMHWLQSAAAETLAQTEKFRH